MIKDLYDLIMDLFAVAEKNKNAELKMLAANIHMRLSEIKKESVDLHEENFKLKRQLEEFENSKEIEKRIIRGTHNVASYTTEKGEEIKICSVCWDNNRKIIQVRPKDSCFYQYTCSVCKTRSLEKIK